jgi:hypothetical protein
MEPACDIYGNPHPDGRMSAISGCSSTSASKQLRCFARSYAPHVIDGVTYVPEFHRIKATGEIRGWLRQVE